MPNRDNWEWAVEILANTKATLRKLREDARGGPQETVLTPGEGAMLWRLIKDFSPLLVNVAAEIEREDG
jgi:hypothetical protein